MIVFFIIIFALFTDAFERRTLNVGISLKLSKCRQRLLYQTPIPPLLPYRSPTSESIHDLNNGTARPIFMNLYAEASQGDQIDHGTEGQQGARLGWRGEA